MSHCRFLPPSMLPELWESSRILQRERFESQFLAFKTLNGKLDTEHSHFLIGISMVLFATSIASGCIMKEDERPIR